MTKKPGNRIWHRAILSFYKPALKGQVIHVVASMTVCLFMAATAFAADFTVSGTETTLKIINADGDTGTVTVSGSITVTNPAGQANAIGIAGGGTNMTILNQGIVSATGTNEVRGIVSVAPLLTNSAIENANTLSVTTTEAWSPELGFLESYGILTQRLDHTSIKNSGTLSAAGAGSVRGIYAEHLSNSSGITNTGALSINQTTAALNSGQAIGIMARLVLDSSVLNNQGTLSVTSAIEGTGIWAEQVSRNSTIINSGQIKLNGPQGTGIFVIALGNGSSVKNTGSISVTQTGAGKTSYGIFVPRSQSAAAAITNTGTIILTTLDPSSSAYGVFSGQTASFENSGTITALDSSNAMGANLYSVQTGGTLTNSGTMKGLFKAGDTINSGLIAMPAFVSTITGNYTQTASGTLGITLFSDDNQANTKFSKLTVSGTANLAAGSGIDVDVTTASAHQKLLTGQTLAGVIESTGGITTDPLALKVTDNSALLKFTPRLSSGDTSLDLGVEKAMTIADAAVKGGYAGVTGAAATLDTLTGSTNPQIRSFLADLNSLPTEGGVARRVQQAAPVNVAQGPAVATQMANTISAVLQARQQGLRGFSSGDAMFSEGKAWVKPYASRVDQDDVDGVSGFSADTFGIGMGADGEVSGENRLGLAFFYTSAKLETHNTPQESDLDVFSLMAYGSSPLMDKTTTLFYQIGGGLQPTESSRYIQALGTKATADYTAKNLFARVKATREFKPAKNVKAIVGPALSYLWFYTPSFQETGAGGMNLNVDSFDARSLVAAIEGDVAWSFPKDVELMARASLGYDMINDDTLVGSSFQGGGAQFSTRGLDNSLVVYGAGLGLAKKFTDRFFLDTQYDLEGRGSDVMTHMVSANLNWKF